MAPVEQRLPLVVEQLVFACRQARPVKAKDLVVRAERVLDRILGVIRRGVQALALTARSARQAFETIRNGGVKVWSLDHAVQTSPYPWGCLLRRADGIAGRSGWDHAVAEPRQANYPLQICVIKKRGDLHSAYFIHPDAFIERQKKRRGSQRRGSAHTFRPGGKTGRRPPGVAPFPTEGAGVLGTRTTAGSEMRRDVSRGGLA